MISWLVSSLVVLLVIAIVIDVNVLDGNIFVLATIAFVLFMLTALAHEIIFGG